MQESPQTLLFKYIREGRDDLVREILRAAPELADAEYVEGVTALFLAVSCGYPEVVRALLDCGADPNGGTIRGWNPLMQAACFNDYKSASLLLAGGAEADVVVSDESGKVCTTPLLSAVWHGNRELAELLLSAGAPVNVRSDWGSTPLATVVGGYDPDFASLLIRYGADVNARDDGSTPLMNASSIGDLETVRLLLDAGADASLRDSRGHSALFIAATSKIAYVAKGPAEDGWDTIIGCSIGWPTYLSPEEKYTILDSVKGRQEVVRLLLEVLDGAPLSFLEAVAIGDSAGVEKMLKSDPRLVEETDTTGNLPLHYAAGAGHIGVAMCLLSHGANVNARNSGKDTPLHIAAEHGDVEMAKLLISWGADANATDDIDATPLHDGTAFPEMVHLLLKCGADAGQADSDGSIPLHHALSSDNPESVMLLIQQGIGINAKGFCGDTPLMAAAHMPEIVRLLLAAGADPRAENEYGESVLFKAAMEGKAGVYQVVHSGILAQGKEESVRILLEACPDLATVFDLVAMGDVEGLKERLKCDLSLLYAGNPQRGNRTLLHYAAECSRPAVAEFLLDQGIDPNVRDDTGDAPLHLAAETDTSEVAQLLIAHGADMNAMDSDWGATPLHEASYHCNVAVAKMLIAHGADVNAKYLRGDTPLMQSECDEIRRLLWRSGATG